ncbi:hypothetical protein ACOSP7_029616 [Xanthoceras sorbifolium]
MPERNLVSWTSVIAGYSQNGKERDAIELYFQMLNLGITPDQFTFGSIIKACSGGGNVGLGRQIHAQVVKSEGFPSLVMTGKLCIILKKCTVMVVTSRMSLYLAVFLVHVAASYIRTMEDR